MDATMFWPVVVFVLKLTLVAGISVLMAVSVWALSHALRHGEILETKPGTVRTRAQAPMRYWLHIASQLLFLAASAITINAIIHLREPREPPAKTQREAPARPNDESYDRAEACDVFEVCAGTSVHAPCGLKALMAG